MGSIEGGPADATMRGERVVRSWQRLVHRVVVVLVQRREPRRGVAPHLILLLLSPLGSSHHGIGASLVGGVVEESANVVDKERV